MCTVYHFFVFPTCVCACVWLQFAVPFRHELRQEAFHVLVAALGGTAAGVRFHAVFQREQLLVKVVDAGRCVLLVPGDGTGDV